MKDMMNERVRELSRLAATHPDRLTVVHWLESVQGLPTHDQLRAFARPFTSYDAFVCGPRPFMDLATGVLRELEFPRDRPHQEDFVSLGGNPFAEQPEPEAPAPEDDEVDDAAPPDARLEIEIDGELHVFDDWAPTTKLIEHLEVKGLNPPFSCREGQCSTCAVRLLEGEVKMLANEVLDDGDLEDGIRLAWQSLPVTDVVRGEYEEPEARSRSTRGRVAVRSPHASGGGRHGVDRCSPRRPAGRLRGSRPVARPPHVALAARAGLRADLDFCHQGSLS